MLSRRLENQMAVINRLSSISPTTEKRLKFSTVTNSEKEAEVEKEREITIIKAALSVAEISEFCSLFL
jgi:hypothetical protein